MNHLMKRAGAFLAAAALTFSLAGCTAAGEAASASEAVPASAVAASAPAQAAGTPKYIFLFIGDGMSYPQIQSTNYYLSALENGTSMGGDGAVLQHEDALSFVEFPVAGSAQTYDSTSFCPDSASTATSISTGHKTYSGTINMDETGTVAYETIAEKLKDQLGYKIGIISSVNLNHATPAAFYCHQVSRNSYYEIGLEMIESGFDYFAGGALLQPTGAEEDQDDLYALAEDAGYTVVRTQAEAEALTAESGKAVVISEQLADGDSIPYELDREDGTWALRDYVAQGIDMLDNDTGFFMMVEGGKIDWTCHANDAATSIHETLAFSDAVQVAIDFAEEHPEETLIIVTGDHETGGMTIGFAATAYDTHFDYLAHQTMSFEDFDKEIAQMRQDKATFEDALAKIQEVYGLTTEADQPLTLNDEELDRIKSAYELSMLEPEERVLGEAEALAYGGYEPLSMAVSHIFNNKAGIAYTSYAHTGLQIPVYAQGVGAEAFNGMMDNTEIFTRTMSAMGLEK